MRQTFTFGSDHNHPQHPARMLGKCYITSPDLPTAENCRTWMTDRFGMQWCMQYDNPIVAGKDTWGLTEVFWAECPEGAQQLWTMFGNKMSIGSWAFGFHVDPSDHVPPEEIYDGIKEIHVSVYGDSITSALVTVTGLSPLRVETAWRNVWNKIPAMTWYRSEDD